MDASPRQASSLIDPDLLARVGKGDNQAFSELYHRTSALLFTLARRILNDRDEAADLLQEIYLEVWCKVVRYDAGRGSPMAWLVTMTRSRAIDRLRSRASKGHGMSDPLDRSPAAQMQDQRPGPLEASADLELRGLVAKALAELPAAQQQALELAYYEGLSHTEIAARLNEPLGTIKTRIKLGMNKLHATLRGYRDRG
jgi:RNA polymerase sigma-70 factor, ECF subfamily